MNKSSNALSSAAAQHLGMLREQHERLERDDRYYVRLAFTYGLKVPQIATKSGLSLEDVQRILAG